MAQKKKVTTKQVVVKKAEVSDYQKQKQSIEGMITDAIKSGLPVETMKEILAMRKELKAEFAKEQFDIAMSNFQAECPEIKRTKSVKTKSGDIAYSYAPLESIVFQVKKLLSENGLSYAIKIEVNGKVKATCIAKHITGHSEESSMEVPLGNKTPVMSDSQVTAAASTFAKRYAFCNAFGIMTGDQDDETKLEDVKVDDKLIDEAKKILNKCKDETALTKAWNFFTKEQRANKEIIIYANQIKSNIQNEKGL